MPALYAVATLSLGAVLARLAWIDRREHRLPDHYTLPLIGMGLAVNAVLGGELPARALMGAVLGFTLFWVVGAAYYRLRGVDGLGLGDAKLFAASGAWVGVDQLPHVLFLAATSALAYAVLAHRDRQIPLAFGPWIALGLIATWVASGLS